MIRIIIVLLISSSAFAQIGDYSFGKGLKVTARDSSFGINFGFRFQTLFNNTWNVEDDNLGKIEDLQSKFSIRRARFKFDGFAYTPKLTYKFEVGLSAADIRIDDPQFFGKGGNLIYDAYINWNFYKGFNILVGQAKMPGNRERIVSSGNLQFVDRSLLNASFNLDRDIGIMLIHNGKIGRQFITKLTAAFVQGEGRNVVSNYGGFEYTFKAEVQPLGKFTAKGDYIQSAIPREEKPKLAIAAAIDFNKEVIRDHGNLGSFIALPSTFHKDLITIFADYVFKYKGFSSTAEFAYRTTDDNDPGLYDTDNNFNGTYYIGSAFNIQAGYLFKSNWEVALRYTTLTPAKLAGNREVQYFIGLSKYVVNHRLKVQTDIGYLQKEFLDDRVSWRLQMEIHL